MKEKIHLWLNRDKNTINPHASFIVTNHFMDRLGERVKLFKTKEDAGEFCRRALSHREKKYTFHDGKRCSKVISEDLVFIIETVNYWSVKLITVYTYNEYLAS